jgi:hypothetical protein
LWVWGGWASKMDFKAFGDRKTQPLAIENLLEMGVVNRLKSN